MFNTLRWTHLLIDLGIIIRVEWSLSKLIDLIKCKVMIILVPSALLGRLKLAPGLYLTWARILGSLLVYSFWAHLRRHQYWWKLGHLHGCLLDRFHVDLLLVLSQWWSETLVVPLVQNLLNLIFFDPHHLLHQISCQVNHSIWEYISVLVWLFQLVELDPCLKGNIVVVIIFIFVRFLGEDIRQLVRGDDDRHLFPLLSSMLKLVFADVSLALKDKLGVISATLVLEEGIVRTLINGDELWCFFGLGVDDIELASCLGVGHHREDLLEHLQQRRLARVGGTM